MSNERAPLNVYAREALAGQLRAGLSDSAYFTYSSASNHDAISLTMPIRSAPYQWDHGLHPVFEMNLPEGALRESLTKSFSKAIKGFNDFDLLGIVGEFQLGRIRVCAGEPSDVPPDHNVHDLLLNDGAHDLFEDLLHTYARFSGVAGVQPKVLLRDAAYDIERFTQRSPTHIIKSWREGEYDQLATNEFFCLRAAKHAGLEVPTVQLGASGKLLAVQRFDLGDDGFLGHEDFCALSGFSARAKYDGTHEGIAKLIKWFVSPQYVAEALRDYFKMTALSAAVQNGDAHLKNFGVIYDRPDGTVRLAPAYDIVSTTPYIPRDSMALTLGGSKAWPKEKMLIKFGRSACGLSEHDCKLALEQVADGIATAAVEMREHALAVPETSGLIEKLTTAWNAGVSRSLMSASPAQGVRRTARPSMR